MSEASKSPSNESRRPIRDGFWLWITHRLTMTAVLVVLAIATGWLMFAYLGFGPLPGQTQPVQADSAPSFETRGRTGLVATGTVVSRKSKSIGSYFAGKVAALKVKKGQRVKRGQLLFRMDTSHLQRQLQSALASASRYARLANQRRRERQEELALLARDHQLLRTLIAETRKHEQSLAQQQNSPVRLAASTSPWSIADLKVQLAASEEYYRKRQRAFHLAVVDSIQRERASRARVAQLRRLIGRAERRSPMDGVVTSVLAGKGHWVHANAPVIRIDDPSSYRVVALVEQQTAQPLDEGQELAVEVAESEGGEIPARLERIVPGWDHQLFYTWLWVKPLKPIGLHPGEEVEVVLPTTEG